MRQDKWTKEKETNRTNKDQVYLRDTKKSCARKKFILKALRRLEMDTKKWKKRERTEIE